MLEPEEQAAYIKAHPKSQKAQDAKKKKSADDKDTEKPKTKKEDINYFLPTYICEAEKLSEYGEDPLILTEDMEVK